VLEHTVDVIVTLAACIEGDVLSGPHTHQLPPLSGAAR
jgi:hypothetical protein